MKEKTGIIIGFGVTALVIGTLILYLLNGGTLGIPELTSLAIVLILILSATYIIYDKAKNLSKGLPAKDERLITISYKAGYYAFIAAIWSAVGAPVISDIVFDYELQGHHVTAIVVLISGLVFIMSYLYMAWKGK